MNFDLKPEYVLAQQLFHDFAQKEVQPQAVETDQTGQFPHEVVAKMQKAGFLGIPFDKVYGGQGCDTLTYVLCIEELAKVCATSAVIVSAHTSLACGAINDYGTNDQKERFLRPLISGRKLGAFALTEPGAGTDAAGQTTKAVLEDDVYVLNGSKIFITNGHEADTYVVFAMTDPQAGTKGISAFIVEKDTPGFEFGTKEDKMGLNGSATYELIFDHCRIPKDNLLGKLGRGYSIAMNTLNGGRIGIAAQALGIAEGALQLTVKYVRQRQQFNRPIAKFQYIQFELAKMATRIEEARHLVYKAAVYKDSPAHKSFAVEAAMAKLAASECATYVTERAVQLHGGYGYMREYEVERMMRDAKVTEIYEGTSEVMRMVIAGDLLR